MKAGKHRRIRRIQEALDRQEPGGMTLSDVARDMDVSYPLVWRTAHGLVNNRHVLRRFLEMGVKTRDLDLPEDMRVGFELDYAEVVNY